MESELRKIGKCISPGLPEHLKEIHYPPAFPTLASEPVEVKLTESQILRRQLSRDADDLSKLMRQPISKTEKDEILKNLEKNHSDFFNREDIKDLSLEDKLDKLEYHLFDLLDACLSPPSEPEPEPDTTKSHKKQKYSDDKDDPEDKGKPGSSGISYEPTSQDNSSKPGPSSNFKYSLDDIKAYLFISFNYLAQIISDLFENFFF
jgi:hypothetical protein